MGLLLTILIIEGVLFYKLNKQKLREQELIELWKQGQLSYQDILALRKSRYYLLKKLNPKVQIGKMNIFKKDD